MPCNHPNSGSWKTVPAVGARPGGEAHLDSFFGGVGPWQAPYSTPLLHPPGAKCTWPQVHFSLLHPPPPPPWSLDPIMPSTFAACRKRTWHNRWLCGGMLPDFFNPTSPTRPACPRIDGLWVACCRIFLAMNSPTRPACPRISFFGFRGGAGCFLSPVSAYGRRQRLSAWSRPHHWYCFP